MDSTNDWCADDKKYNNNYDKGYYSDDYNKGYYSDDSSDECTNST